MSILSDKDRHELSLLLPWYANGTLNEEDILKVEDALAKDEALAREFDLVLEDQAAAIELVSEEEVPISITERFKAALNAEEAEPAKSAKSHVADESWIGRIAALLSPGRTRAYAYAAAAIILLVPAVAIFSVGSGNQQTGPYQTASGEEETAIAKERMLVKFNAEVAWTKIDAILKKNRGQVIKGPTADGLYQLEFEKSEGLAERLGAEIGVFEFVLPAN